MFLCIFFVYVLVERCECKMLGEGVVVWIIYFILGEDSLIYLVKFFVTNISIGMVVFINFFLYLLKLYCCRYRGGFIAIKSSLSLDESPLSSISDDSKATIVLPRACLNVAISFLRA